MSIRPEELLLFAEELLVTFDSEVAFRDCVSKSYYADFHTVLQNVSTKVQQYKNMGTHQRLIASLEDAHDVKTKEMKVKYRQLAYYLKSRKQSRAQVDYDLFTEVTKKDAIEAIKASRRLQCICESIKELESSQKKLA